MSGYIEHRRVGDEGELMIESCVALMASMFGEANWSRWNGLRRQCQYDFQTFVTWLLDVAEANVLQQDTGEDECTAAGSQEQLVKVECGADVDDVQLVDDDMNQSYHPVEPQQQQQQAAMSSAHEVSGFDTTTTTGGSTSGTAAGEVIDVSYSPDGGGTFYCCVCQVSLSDVEVVREHLTLRHDRCARLRISCHCGCEQTFDGIPHYVSYHRQRALGAGGGAQHICDVCAKTFANRRYLEEHVIYKHQKSEPIYECPRCGKRFRYSRGLSAHSKKCVWT